MQKMQADEVEKAIEYIDESLKLARQQEDASLIQGALHKLCKSHFQSCFVIYWERT